MTIKEQIIQELEEMPEPMLEEILKIIVSLKEKPQVQTQDSEFWNAYLKSKQQRKEVYRRLADS